MAQKTSGEQWDYVWNYTDGLPENNGATKVTSGTTTINMRGDGLAISARTGSYVAYRFPSYNTENGEIEAEFIMPSSIGANQNIRIGYGDGTNGFQIQAPSGNITPMDTSTPSAGSLLGQDNIVKVKWNNSKGAFWVNGDLVGENQSPTSYSSNTQVMIQQTNDKIITLRSIRIRKG